MKDDRVYLQHIRDAITDVIGYTRSGRDVFLNDRMRQDATLRKLEVIGQAVKNLSDACKLREPSIPWRQFIHDYFGVNLEIVWGVIEKELPKLNDAVHRLLLP